MKRALILTFLLFCFSGLSAHAQTLGDIYLGGVVCDETQEALDIGEEYSIILQSPLVLAAALVHVNRTRAGADLDRGDGCLLASIWLKDGGEIAIFKFRDISGEFASRYQFIRPSDMGSGRLIALNTFFDVDAIAHELGYIGEGVRLYLLEAISPEEIASHYFFAGEPSVNRLIDYVLAILNEQGVPPVRLELTGDEPTVVMREDLLEEEWFISAPRSATRSGR